MSIVATAIMFVFAGTMQGYEISADHKIVRVDPTTGIGGEVLLDVRGPKRLNVNYAWETTRGQLDTAGERAALTQLSSGWALVTVSAFDSISGELLGRHSVPIFAWRWFYCILADDLYGKSWTWARFMTYMRENQIPHGVGLITGNIDESQTWWTDELRDYIHLPFVEAYNHGWLHTCAEWMSSEEDQIATVAQTNEKAERLFGVNYLGWVPPGNCWNEHTTSALLKSGIRWASSRPHDFPRNVPGMAYFFQYGGIEGGDSRIGDVSLDYFKLIYMSRRENTSVVAGFVHPNHVGDTENDWSEFLKVLEFIRLEQITLIRPSDFLTLFWEGVAPIDPRGDEDADGLNNYIEGRGDTDGDGAPDFLDSDSDFEIGGLADYAAILPPAQVGIGKISVVMVAALVILVPFFMEDIR